MLKQVTIFMLIALCFFNFNIVSDHWERFEGRGGGGGVLPSPRKNCATLVHFLAKIHLTPKFVTTGRVNYFGLNLKSKTAKF